LPTPPAAIARSSEPDPIFAVITAHRGAQEELNKAITASDVPPSPRTEKPSARILVGSKDGTQSSWTETEGGGFTLIVTPTGRKEPVYVMCPAQIWENQLQRKHRGSQFADGRRFARNARAERARVIRPRRRES
jgi:hypothetical protein